MNQWKKLKTKEEAAGTKVVTYKDFKMPDGSVQNYTTWSRENAFTVAVIALTKDNKVIVARQFRPGPETVLDEIPGGRVDSNEDHAVAAVRELREETGYESTEPLRSIGTACRDAYSNEKSEYFIVRNCELKKSQDLDDTEHIEVVLISVEELIDNACNAKMSDAVAVLMAYNELKEIQNAQKSY
jgi:ADP-ribose pyrophosphatase